MAETFATVEDYLDSLSEDSRAAVEEVRQRIHAALPGAHEVISYNIPTLKQDGRSVVHFAGWKGHVSLYPAPEGDEALQQAVTPYVSGKGTVKFPLSQPMPLDLVQRIVEALVAERGSD